MFFHFYKKTFKNMNKQETQLLLGDRATRKHAKDSCMPRIAEMDVEITT